MQENSREDDKLARPPVAVVVGHVDHGKTSLLDYIRKTNVAGKEAGGITQSFGAYEVEHNGKKITFIDTPGHEAFQKMRSRGATIADLAVLVVAADEGVKPQTIEAIEILKRTETPFVVAITKIDKPSANIDKVKNELQTAGVLLEGYGGDVSFEPVSVISGEGIDKLLDLILLLSEVKGLTWAKGNRTKGFILEAFKDSRRGITVHAILKDGVLREGDQIATGTAFGKIKTLENFLRQRVKELYPSAPALILGFETMPQVGEEVLSGKVNLAEIVTSSTAKTPEVKAPEGEEKLSAIFRADTVGSLEALEHLLSNLVTVKDRGVGEITDGDIQLAISTGSIVIGFKVKPTKSAENLARIHQVMIFNSEIIYELSEAIQKFVKGEKAPQVEGELKVLKIFGESQGRQIVGGRVLNGFMKSGAVVQIERIEKNLGEGKIINLQENRQDVALVSSGKECGLLIESDVKINVGDVLRTVVI